MSAFTATSNRPTHQFDYHHDPILADVHAGYWQLKDCAPPLFWTPANGGHWVANNGAIANHIMRHPEIFSSKILAIPPRPDSPKMIPITLDPPEHRSYRQMLRPFFESKAIAPLEQWIIDWTNRLIDAVIDKKECEFVDAISSRLPVSIFMEMLGLSMDRFDEFRKLVVDFFKAAGGEDIDERLRLQGQIHGIIHELVTARMADPKSDLMSQLVTLDFEGRKLTYEELMSIGFLMFLAGLDTVVNAMSFGMNHLSHDEVLQQRIIDDPDCIPNVVEELLRRYAFVNTPRLIVEDVEIDGVQMKAGETVLVPLMMIGWDEKLNACPHQVSVDRPAYRHGAFGTGVHTCLGIHLARMELRNFYALWFKRIGKFRRANPDAPLHMRGGNVMAIEQLDLRWD